MSSFPISTTKDLLDDAVRRTRANPPPAEAVNKRAVPRMSIDEINATDWDTLREKYLNTRRDDRGPVEKFLDLIDAPRNTISAILAPGLERREREAGNTGAFGQGRVGFSDMLGEIGLKPGVTRAVLGFVGDVALDPLTYVGPAGWGAKVAKGGQAARIGLRGRRALTTGLKDVAKGGIEAIKDAPTRSLMEAAGKPLTGTGEDLARQLGEKVVGPVTQGRVGRAMSRVGGDTATKSGILADFDQFGLAGQAGEETSAVRQWLQNYGAGQGPGVRIGKDASGKLRIKVGTGKETGIVAGSTVAHIPFTEFGIHVPAFTGEGRAAAQQMRVVSSTGRVQPILAMGPSAAAVNSATRAIEQIHTDLANGHVDPAVGLQEIREHAASIEDILKGKMEGEVRRGIDPATPENIGELLSLRRLTEEAHAAADMYEARALRMKGPEAESAHAAAAANLRFADAVQGAAKQYADVRQGAEIDAVKRMLGMDDDIMGVSLVAPYSAASRGGSDPSIAADLLGRADRGVRKGMKGVFGPSQGMLRNQMRMHRNGLTTGAREAFNAAEAQIRNDIIEALHDSGIDKIDADTYDAAAQMAFAHMYSIRNSEDPSLGVFFTKRFGTEEPAEWVSKLDKAQKSGMLASASDKLRAVAERNVRALDTLGSEEIQDEILGNLLGGEAGKYVPTATTPEANARIASVRNQQVVRERASGVPSAGVPREQFQKKRSMLQYRFKNDDGQWRRFFEKDRWVMEKSPQELAAIKQDDPASASHIDELVRDISEYDLKANTDPEWAAINAPRHTDAWELNELVRDGHFDLLKGGDPIESGFADTNMATVMASRLAAHERAVARRSWLEFVGSKGISVNPAELQGAKRGETLVLKDGSEAKFYRDDKSGEWGFEHMGQRYRPLQRSVQGLKDNPIIQGMGDTVAKVYHEDIARAVEDSSKLYDDPSPLLQALDKATGAWKSVQLMHPSWTVGNVVGDTINYLTGGVRPQDIVTKANDVAYAVRHTSDPEALAGRFVTIRGEKVPAEQFVNDLRSNRLLGTNAHAETAMQLVARKFFVLPSQLKGASGRGVLSDFAPATLKADFLQRLSHEAAAKRTQVGKVSRAVGFVARDRLMRRVIAPWFRANEKVNDYMRALAYTSFLEQGNDMATAVNRTVRAGFDYSDLTRVERNYFRRLLPFYSWMRLNGAYQLKQLLERPIYAGAFPLLRDAAEEALNGDKNVPLHARPAWMRQQLALQVGSDPETRQALLLGSGLPQEQAFQAGAAVMGSEGMQDFMHYFLTGLNPVIRTPIEIAARREFFTDKTIGKDGDVSVPGYIAQQFRPVREMQALRKATSGGAGSVAGRVLVGGRLQPFSDERIRLSKSREFQTQEDRLRSRIRTAVNKNDPAGSVAARAKLLRLYEQMVQQGYDKEVPAWARKRLASLATLSQGV